VACAVISTGIIPRRRVARELILYSDLTDKELQEIPAAANFQPIMIRYPALRWDSSEVGLIGNYVLYYPFKLNMPNLIYGIRKFVDTLRGYYEEHKSDERLFRKQE
jgi:hypothetical protein